MVLGILFEKMNVTFLVGWAFNVAASANLPALVMLLFWKRHDQAGHHRGDPRRHGVLARLGPAQRRRPTSDVYGLPARATRSCPFSQPGLVTIPLGFAGAGRRVAADARADGHAEAGLRPGGRPG